MIFLKIGGDSGVKNRFFNKFMVAASLATTFRNGRAAPLAKQSSLQQPDDSMNGNSVEVR